MEWDVFGKGGFSVLPKRPGSKYDSSVEIPNKIKPNIWFKTRSGIKNLLDMK